MILTLQGWAHYRLSQFEDAHRAFLEAGGLPWAREGLAQLAAKYLKNDALLMEIAVELPGSVGVQNALIIRAQAPDSKISHNEVMAAVRRVMGSSEIAATNAINNAARFFQEKPRGDGVRHRITALGLFEAALVRYGEGDANLHHRGALCFWKSKLLETLFGKAAAIPAQRESVRLWRRQVELDPKNLVYAEKLANNEARLAELESAVSPKAEAVLA